MACHHEGGHVHVANRPVKCHLRTRTTGQSTSKAGSKKENTSGKSVPKGEVWEVDFCSRPLVDARGKRVWEIMICNPERTFEFAQYIPNNKVPVSSALPCARVH